MPLSRVQKGRGRERATALFVIRNAYDSLVLSLADPFHVFIPLCFDAEAHWGRLPSHMLLLPKPSGSNKFREP